MFRLIRYFIKHRTAANLGMILAVCFGLASLAFLNVQLWPTYKLKWMTVETSWRGASVSAMDRLVGRELDGALNAITGVKRVYTTSYPGRTKSWIRFNDDTNMQEAISQVQSAIAAISTFPADMEQPVVKNVPPTERVARLLVSGPLSNSAIQALSKDLIARFRAAGGANVSTRGVIKPNIYIDVDAARAKQFGTSIKQIGAAVQTAVHASPGGTYQGDKVRHTTSTLASHNFSTLRLIPVATPKGQIKLEDIATISRQIPNQTSSMLSRTGTGFFLEFRRNHSENVLDITDKINATIAKLQAELPKTITMQLYDVRSEQIRDRIQLLGSNAIFGLGLVALLLFIFLNFRAALWVVIGIPTAFALSFILMWATGQTINMVSVFTMVMILGIIVDDAIVVAENIATRQAENDDPARGAYLGAKVMWRPVLTATMTTIAAFAPIVFLTDAFGGYVRAIPYFVVVALLASLAECFLLLPGHMRGGGKGKVSKPSGLRALIDRGLFWFIRKPFARLISAVYRLRYVAMAGVVGFVAFAAILASTNQVRFQFWLNPQSNFLYANLTMLPGASAQETQKAIRQLWQGLEKAEKQLGYEKDALVKVTYGLSGKHFTRRSEPHETVKGAVLVELADDSNGKRVSSAEFVRLWRKSIPSIPGLESLEIEQTRSGPEGADVDISATGDDVENVKAAVRKIGDALRKMKGVENVADSLTGNATQLQFSLSQTGLTRGFSSQEVGRQLFDALSGIKADRVATGASFADVIVRYKTAGSVENTLSHIPLQALNGEKASFFDIATLEYGKGETLLKRYKSKLTATVRAETDRKIVDAPAVWKELEKSVLPAIEADHNVRFTFEGKRKERKRAFDEITIALLVGVIAIYVLLAWSMESFALPFAIMAVLPLGAAGAVIGHYVLDHKMTMLSLVALVALFGILVNDSIILFEEIRNRKRAGQSLYEATISGYGARFRPVFLTTITTIAGLGPLIFESSYQALFLIPIAITITWGLGFATIMSFLLVPATIAIAEDFRIVRKKDSETEGNP